MTKDRHKIDLRTTQKDSALEFDTFKDRMKWSGNYKDHICAITIKNAKSEDAGRWRCEIESYARGKYRGYGYNVTSEFDIKFIPKATTTGNYKYQTL